MGETWDVYKEKNKGKKWIAKLLSAINTNFCLGT